MDSLLELDGEVLVPEMDDSLEEENLDPNFDDIGTRFVMAYADKTESSFTE